MKTKFFNKTNLCFLVMLIAIAPPALAQWTPLSPGAEIFERIGIGITPTTQDLAHIHGIPEDPQNPGSQRHPLIRFTLDVSAEPVCRSLAHVGLEDGATLLSSIAAPGDLVLRSSQELGNPAQCSYDIIIAANSDDGDIRFTTRDAAAQPPTDTEKFTILNNGNVGIGNSSPGSKLSIFDDTSPWMSISGTKGLAIMSVAQNPGTWSALATEGDFSITAVGSTSEDIIISAINKDLPGGAIRFGTVPDGAPSNIDVERMTIHQNGNVGIAQPVPLSKLHIEDGSEAGLTSNGFFMIGDISRLNLVFDDDEIIARNNGGVSDLNLQGEGGDVLIHADLSPDRLFVVKDDGKIGIGVNNPQSKVHIEFGSEAGLSSHGFQMIGSPTGSNLVMDEDEIMARSNGVSAALNLQSEGGDFTVHNDLTVDKTFVVKDNGNVGIGVADPLQKLVVDGTVCAKEVRVSLAGAPCWSDFVFEDDYILMPLAEVEHHIKQNRHLPDIPSAAEVEANGVELGVMQARLLQKIEELTLYVIDQDKRLQRQEEEIAKLRNINLELQQTTPSLAK